MVRERNPPICLFDHGVISLDIDTEDLIVIRVSHDQMQKEDESQRGGVGGGVLVWQIGFCLYDTELIAVMVKVSMLDKAHAAKIYSANLPIA